VGGWADQTEGLEQGQTFGDYGVNIKQSRRVPAAVVRERGKVGPAVLPRLAVRVYACRRCARRTT
jgi:hypothetical protein